MTVSQAIARTDRLKPNSYAYPDKLQWLSQLDGRVKKEILDTHEGGDELPFVPYSERGGGDRELLIPAPYDETYIHYLSTQIDYFNGEYERFNNANSMFESTFSAFRNAYNREHPAKGVSRNYF